MPEKISVTIVNDKDTFLVKAYCRFRIRKTHIEHNDVWRPYTHSRACTVKKWKTHVTFQMHLSYL